MAASINYLTTLPPELLLDILSRIGDPTISSVSKLFKELSDHITTTELLQIWKYLHPGQEFSDDSDLEAVKAIYHNIFQRVPQNAVGGTPRVSLERFKETDNINDTLTFWRELPGGAPHVTQQNFRGLSLADIRAQLSTWMQGNNIQVLELREKSLRYLPPEIGNLANLQILNLSGNQLTMLPKEIGNLANLMELNLQGNQLTGLPTEIGNLANLRTLYLRGNQLTVLPSSFANSPCKIRLSPNTYSFILAATAYNFFELSPEQQNAVYGCIYTLAIASGVNVEPWDHEYGKNHVFDSEERLVAAMNKALEEHPQEVS